MTRFLHIADTHLDYQQYGILEREQDAYTSLAAVFDYAILQSVDVLLVAGDFFHSKDIRARAWLRVRELLDHLKAAGVTVVMVEGNHDRTLFGTDETWVETLESEGLARVLGTANRGDIFEIGGVRVIGMPYMGHKEVEGLDNVYGTLELLEPMTTILLCHIGISEVMGDIVPGLSLADLESRLHASVRYVATGHFHRPWSKDRVHCPGTIFPNKIDEPYGGMFLFEADQDGVRDVRYVPIEQLCDVRAMVQAEAEDLDRVATLSKDWEGAIVQLVYRGLEGRDMIESVFVTKPLKFIPLFRPKVSDNGRRDYQASSTGELETILLGELLGEHAPVALSLMQYALEGQPASVMIDLVKEKVGASHAD